MCGASIYHTQEWFDFLQKTLGWHVRIAICKENGVPRFLPFVDKRHLWRRKNICLPISHKVGFMADAPQRHRGEIVPLESLKNLEIHEAAEIPNGKKYSGFSISILNLKDFLTEKELYAAFNKSSIQRKISKAEKEGVIVADESRNPQAFLVFEDMQTETRIRQKSLMYPPGFFSHLYSVFKDTGWLKLYIAYKGGRPLAGIIFFQYEGVATYAYGASYSLPEVSSIGANQAAMWAAIRAAYTSGNRLVDFGISPKEKHDLIAYKAKWGAKTTEMYYTSRGENLRVSREGRGKRLVLDMVCALPRPLYTRISAMLMKALL